MTVVSMNYLLEAGVHFGHQKRRWNPKMREYIYTSRDDIYIIDLQKTSQKIDEAYEAMKEKILSLPKSLIIANRDSIALAALNAALDLNLNVPEDYEFMAMLGTKYSELSRPKLSSFNIDMKGLGRTGLKVLKELVENDNEGLITQKLSFKYVKRGSTL